MIGGNTFGWAYPGQGYAGSTTAAQEYTDSATITVALTPSVAEVFEGADSYTAYVDVQPSGVDALEHVITDAATAYLDMQPLGGECFSTFTGLQLEAEAYARWSPGAQEDRWSETEDCRWLASEPEILYPLEGDGFARWHPTAESGAVRWLADDEPRWNVVGITAAGVIC